MITTTTTTNNNNNVSVIFSVHKYRNVSLFASNIRIFLRYNDNNLFGYVTVCAHSFRQISPKILRIIEYRPWRQRPIFNFKELKKSHRLRIITSAVIGASPQMELGIVFHLYLTFRLVYKIIFSKPLFRSTFKYRSRNQHKSIKMELYK